ncbi:hypothetical protein HHI36_006001 [Cryptolaemus montrouzieri]|uniref:Uncharacterized protein n=1 Tax=Cryptolaemus montrouzieri TaxID=559131 RepID=A0ABD2NW19_9CUCU
MSDCGRLIGAHLNIPFSATCFLEFKDCVEESGIDIIGLTETWLNDGSELMVRMEGSSFVCNNRATRGGGTDIYIRDGLRFDSIGFRLVLENTSVVMKTNDIKILFCVLYKPPGIGIRTLYADIEDIVMASLPVAVCVVVVLSPEFWFDVIGR